MILGTFPGNECQAACPQKSKSLLQISTRHVGDAETAPANIIPTPDLFRLAASLVFLDRITGLSAADRGILQCSLFDADQKDDAEEALLYIEVFV